MSDSVLVTGFGVSDVFDEMRPVYHMKITTMMIMTITATAYIHVAILGDHFSYMAVSQLSRENNIYSSGTWSPTIREIGTS